MNNKVLAVLQGYLALTAQDRIAFIKEINKIEKMPNSVKKDHEKMLNTLGRG